MFRSRVGLLAAVVLPAMIVAAQGCTGEESVLSPEQHAQEINKSLMCPVCPGESIDQSQNPLAKQMREIVRDKLDTGWTAKEIRQFFVDRYGPSVLMAPPIRGFNLLAWMLPPVFVVGAGLALYLVLRSMRQPWPAPVEVFLSEEERHGYCQRVEEMVEGGGGDGGWRGAEVKKRNGDADG